MTGSHAQTEMRSVLFTDLVGSTELRVRLGEDDAEDLRRTHDRLLADAVTGHGGQVVKGLGDGIMASFSSAADAVGAAVAIEQAADLHARHHPEKAFAVRVGISVGDVTLEGNDVFGVPVVEASRLCASANGGEILVADLVRTLCRTRGGFQFEQYGELELKGLPEPLATCKVFWEPAEDVEPGTDTSIAFPPLLAATTPYVGRGQLLSSLEDAFAGAGAGGCRMTLLAGEPGVGKTRTAAELAHKAHSAGAAVLYGRCDEDLGLPYQPFVEALDFYTGQWPEPRLGRLPGELVRLLPELPERVKGLARPIASDPRSEEHLLFEAIASWLVELATEQPVVLVLDDLHWADKPTLLLLQHLLRAGTAAGRTCGLLVLGTYRDTDIDRSHPLSGVLADLRRLPNVERRPVVGLSEAEVEQFIAAAAGHALDDETRAMADAVYAETEGNPFFVGEVLRHLVETGAVVRRDGRWSVADPGTLSVPEGVRDVIGRRLSRLSPAANDLLATAAVIGRDVDVELVVELSDLSEGTLLDALDEAVRARLIDETGPDRYRFSHALIRATLYEEQSATRRRRQHRRVAEALEKLRPDDVVALAYHLVEAGPEGGLLARAVRYSLAAAGQSLAARAPADAERRFHQVLELLDESDLGDDTQRLEALLGIGECQRDQGDPGFRDTLIEVASRAREAGEVSLLVRAVLASTRGFGVIGVLDTERVALTRAALDAVGPEPTAERAKLLSLLSSDLVFEHGAMAEARAVGQEAERIAREIDDSDLLAHVLVRTHFSLVSLDTVAQNLARAEEAVARADRSGDPALRAFARYFLSGELITLGEIARSNAVTADALEVATEASPGVRWIMETMANRIPLLEGRLEETRERSDACLAAGQRLGEGDAWSWWAALMCMLEWERDDLAWMADAVKAFADHFSGVLTWRTGLVGTLATGGRIAEARAVVEAFALTPAEVLIEPFPATGAAQLAALAFFGRDASLAGEVREALAPYRGYWAHYNLATFGPISLYLAMCDWAAGDLDEAVAGFEETEDRLVAARADGLLPLTQRFHAELLVDRGADGDLERARQLLGLSRAGAERIGAPVIAQKCEEMAARIAAA